MAVEMSTTLKFTLAMRSVLSAEKRDMYGESQGNHIWKASIHSNPDTVGEAIEVTLKWFSYS